MTKVTKNENNKRKQISWDLSYTGLLIFLLFRIPLTNIIGNEGNGYYFVSFEIFTIFYIIFGFGFHQTAYELVRKNIKKFSSDARGRLFSLLLLFAVVSSLIGALIILCTSKWILAFLHVELSIISLRLLTVWLVISTVCGIFRGYFEGCGTRIPTAFSRIIEAIVAGSGSLVFASLLCKYGAKVGELLFNQQYNPAFGASGIIAGLLCGSLFSVLFLFVVYQFYQRAQKQASNSSTVKETSKKSLTVDICKTYILCLSGILFMYSYHLVNMVLYVLTLKKQVQEEQSELNILSLIGSYHGKILVLLGIVILIILSISGNNVSRIRKYYSKNSFSNCWKYAFEDIKQITFISVPVCIIYCLLSEQILNLFYGKANLTEINFLKIGSLNIIFIPMAIYLYHLIQRLSLKLFCIILPMIAFAAQSVLMYIFVTTANTRMLSIVIAEVIFWFLLFTLEVVVIMKEFGQIFSKK